MSKVSKCLKYQNFLSMKMYSVTMYTIYKNFQNIKMCRVLKCTKYKNVQYIKMFKISNWKKKNFHIIIKLKIKKTSKISKVLKYQNYQSIKMSRVWNVQNIETSNISKCPSLQHQDGQKLQGHEKCGMVLYTYSDASWARARRSYCRGLRRRCPASQITGRNVTVESLEDQCSPSAFCIGHTVTGFNGIKRRLERSYVYDYKKFHVNPCPHAMIIDQLINLVRS